MGWLRRFCDSFRRAQIDKDIEDDVEFHLEQSTHALLQDGLSSERASQALRRRFGSLTSTRQRISAEDTLVWLDELIQDVTYAWRTFVRSGAFGLTVLSLGVSVGATSAVYVTADWVLNQPPASILEPERLITLQVTESGRTDLIRDGFGMSIPQFTELREIQDAFVEIAAYGKLIGIAAADTRTDQIVFEFVTGKYFEVLGLRPLLGRLLSPIDDVEGTPPVAVLSFKFWRSHFGGDPSVIGRSLQLNGVATRVVGVLPPDFEGFMLDWAGTSSLWVPMQAAGPLGYGGFLTSTQASFFRIIGRMLPDINISLVRERAQTWLPQIPPLRTPAWEATEVIVLSTTNTRIFGPGRERASSFFTILLVVCGLVLLAACVNLGNFILGRAVSRKQELAVRRALGATDIRLVQQLGTEVLLVGLSAGVLAVGIGAMIARALAQLPQYYLGLVSLTNPFDSAVSLDSRFLAVTLVAAVFVALLFGLVPVLLQLRRQPFDAIKGSGGQCQIGFARVTSRQAILVLQIALSVSLAVTAGSYSRSFLTASSFQTPFADPDSVLVARLGLTGLEARQREPFFSNLLTQLDSMPEVVATSVRGGSPYQVGFSRASLPESPEVTFPIQVAAIGPGYFEVAGIPVVAGQEFSVDAAEQASGLMINRVLAGQLWPDQNAVGRTIQYGDELRQVTGIVADDHCADLLALPQPCAWQLWTPTTNAGYLHIRTTRYPLEFSGTLRQLVRDLNPNVAVAEVSTLSEILDGLTRPERIAATITSLLATLAVALMTVGTGTLFLSMMRGRIRDLAIRVALGATRWTIARRVLQQGAGLLVVGSAIGLAVAYVLSQRITNQLFNVSTIDAFAFVAVPLVVASSGLVAVGYAAHVAARADPASHLSRD